MGKRTRNFLIILLGLFMGTSYGFGQVENLLEAPSPPESVAPAAPVDGEGVGDLEGAAPRDPFWPVGWQPQEEVVEAEIEEEVEEVDDTGPIDFSGLTPEEQEVIRSTMSVGGILKQNDICIAIINNRVMRQGQTLTMEADNKHYEFLVKTLTPTRIILESAH